MGRDKKVPPLHRIGVTPGYPFGHCSIAVRGKRFPGGGEPACIYMCGPGGAGGPMPAL